MGYKPVSKSEVLLAIDGTRVLAGFGIRLANENQNRHQRFCAVFVLALRRINLSMSDIEMDEWGKPRDICPNF
jgi:hypothetical protein